MLPPFCFEVKSYDKRIVIGCADDEQLSAQQVVFDVLAWLPARPELLVDMKPPAFDYCVLTDAVDAACARLGTKILQEPLAFDVMGRIFASSAWVGEVEVFIRKTERYAHTQWIGFRLRLDRPQWQAMASQIESLRTPVP